MKKCLTFSIILLSCLHPLVATVFEPPRRQVGELSCLRLLALKDIYDSGFRPYPPGSRIRTADIRLKLPDANQFVSFGVDGVVISSDEHDAVTHIFMYTPYVPVEQAGAMIKELVRSLNSVPRGLDEALARATIDNPKWADVTWTQDWSNDWARVSIEFDPLCYVVNDASKGRYEMKAAVRMNISWNETESEEQASTTPWSVIAVSIVAALGLVWLWRRRRSRV